ncbi:MAG: glycosyltransferase [Candidatus Hydrothermarchaeota archaeon]
MLSIIIPTKDEPRIQELVDEINGILSGEFEIIVVDKSKATPKINGAFLIKQKSNGLGNAFLEGLKESRGEKILLMDGDYQHDPKDIPLLLREIEDNDIVLGSRYVKGGKVIGFPFYRKIISQGAIFLTKLFLGLDLKDPITGFACFKREKLENIKLSPRGFKIVLEIIAKNKEAKIKEVPITFRSREEGKSKFNLKEALEFLRLLIRLRFLNED